MIWYGVTCLVTLMFYLVILAVVCVSGYQFLIVKQNFKVKPSLIFYGLALAQTLCRVAQYSDYTILSFQITRHVFNFGDNMGVMANYFAFFIGFVQCSSM